MKKQLIIILLPFFINAQTFIFNNKVVSLEKISKNIYKNDERKELKIKDNFFLKIDNNVTIETILNNYNLHIVKSYSTQLYLVKSSENQLLELIEEIDSDIDVIYAYPNFYKKLEKR